MTEDEQLAFPTGNPIQGGHSGMTQRQWYAGQAIIGILAADDRNKPLDHKIALAFRVADKMIKLEEDGE